MITSYDFDDPEIRAMVNIKHKPIEYYSYSYANTKRLENINCGICAQDWPCSAIKGLRSYERRIQNDPQVKNRSTDQEGA